MAAVSDWNTMIDETYEYSAPRFFDFIDGETEEEMKMAELWFETALSYAPSPFMPRIKSGRSVHIETLCNFGDEEKLNKEGGSSSSTTASTVIEAAVLAVEVENSTRAQPELAPIYHHEEETKTNPIEEVHGATKPCEDEIAPSALGKESAPSETASTVIEPGKENTGSRVSAAASIIQGTDVCTPIPQTNSKKEQRLTGSRKNQTAKKIASAVRNPSALKPRNQSQSSQSAVRNPSAVKPRNPSQLSQAKWVNPTPVRSATTAKKPVKAPDFAQENQAIKRQKLDGGRSRQILNPKTQNLPHKSRPGGGANNLCLSSAKTRKEDRKVYAREEPVPFVSMAEMVRRFQSGTRGDMSLPHRNTSISHDEAASIIQRKPKLTLTRPKEPEFETSHRVRSVRVKSSAELEEEMMAKIPKFKARPVSKKILEGLTSPALPRSTHLPESVESA